MEVAPSRTVGVSASVNLPLHHKVQKFSSGTGSPGWSRKKSRKTVVFIALCRIFTKLVHWPCYILYREEVMDVQYHLYRTIFAPLSRHYEIPGHFPDCL